jgi:hypothetical protein
MKMVLPKSAFPPVPMSVKMLKRLTKSNTYLAIDYGLAFWAYMYLTVSAIAMACVFAVLISLPSLVLAAFSFSTNLLVVVPFGVHRVMAWRYWPSAVSLLQSGVLPRPAVLPV